MKINPSLIDINQCIDSLPDEYRVPFIMFLNGSKFIEIAQKLDLPVDTIKRSIFLSRVTLTTIKINSLQ
ncbi:RNA polymerase sigma factor [Prolixibacter sp. NT017]|uniref:RNA polymerase sigma factor n=1 Tax=Prolixibacter sp. NT017 TaxID=2652390 RepID=UPI00126C76D8|nr:hypothetical protein NT017_07560 [Prolixibacter sp. NT017]